MTSTANNQIPPAPNQPAIPSGPSYANAAGATKKPGSTPLIATGSNPPPVVVGSSAPTSQHVKTSSVSPANGRPSIPPAVPTVAGAPPAVVHGSSLNGGLDHSRRSSVTIPNGPNSHFGNGGPVGGTKTNIRFGGFESPAVAHSTPQAPGSNPIPIPSGNPRITSPAHSPAPIPQPSASGGRPPSGLQQPTSQMIFGSPSGDGDRHMRQPSIPATNPALAAQSHIRKESSQSMHSEMSNPGMPGPGPGRGGFQQGGRGRGGFNPHNQPFNGHMGYPPQNFRNGPGQGRAIPPAFQPGRGQMPPYGPNSPQPARASPALPPSIPGTPNMGAASMQPQMATGPLPSYHYAPPAPPAGYGYPPAFDNYGRPLSMPPMSAYQMPFMQQQGTPAYQPQYVQPSFQPHGPGPQNMSRTPSQGERPNSSTGQQNHPVIVSGTVQGVTPKPPTTNFARAKSSAITIKNDKGETISFSNINAPASPAPSIQQSKTPPVIASTPTPPPKPSTPAHVRTDSQAATKTAKEIQDEMREKVMQKAKEDKAKEDEAAAKAAEAEAKAKAAAEAEEARKKAEEEAKAARDAEAAAEAKKKEEEAEKKRLEEEELERQIQEMEEEEARREEEERKFNEEKKLKDEAAKKKKEEERLANAAEEDRKLKEQEAEMERLEEEKERRRKEADASGKTISFQEALAAAKPGGTPTPEATPVVTVTDKMASLSINADSKPSTPTDASAQKTPTDKQRGPKPPALNLDRLTSKPVEPPPPSAALQSLKSARFLTVMGQDIYPAGISSPNPALNSAVAKKGRTFKYDANFLLQFQKVFTEQPSVEFHQQVKSLIGDTDGSRSAKPQSGSGRQNSRPGATPFSSMGSFVQAAPGGRTLPPGTTSADRFNMSSGAMARPNVPSMGTFPQGRGAFPTPMARTPSSHNMGHAPGSPRVGSKRGSRRPNDAAKEAQAAKAMPLTANIEIEPIKISSTGWKPSSIGNRSAQAQPAAGSNLMDPETVQRKVKAALNKMTPEKFDKIADQILEIAAQSKHEVDGRTLRQVIQLTFEKATDEAHWASMYAKFCKRMLETMSPEIRDESIKDKAGNVVSGGALFRKYLLNRCQEEFERGWKANAPEPENKDDKKILEAAMLSDEYYIAAAAKRRGLGLVQFIGELYKLGMLTERIMHECVKKLLDYSGIPDEAEIESLSKLLRTIGASLDATEKGRPMMDAYFSRIQTMMDLPELPSRLKFMLMDVCDLRRVNWVSKETNKGPKTLDEVRAEAEAQAAQKAAEAARSNQRGGPGRPPMGRGDARQFSSQFNQPASNQVGMDDLRRLKGSASRTASQNVTLGPTSMFASRSNSGRRLGPGGSLSRGGDDSGPASRTGTPPTQSSHSNAFSLLANMETENPASPPSTAASPSLSKVVPDNSTGDDKKGSD